MENTQKKMYFGPVEVTMVIEMPYKTPSGADVVKVCLDRKVQPYEILPKTTFEELVSLEPVNDTVFQEKRYKNIIDNFIMILLETGIIYADIPYLCKAIHNHLNTSYERATNYLWTKNDAEFIPGVHELTNRSLLEVDVILRDVRPESQ